jgi:Acyltransferase C-terminus
MDPTPEEASVFEQWLRNLWRDKDALFERFLATGSFSDEAKSNDRDSGVSVGTGSAAFTSGVTEIPVELRSNWEILDAFSGFAPVLVPALAWVLWKRIT